MRLGATEILLILAIAILVFGSNKLSGLGKALGTSIREFKEEVKNPGNAEAKEGGENDNKSAKE